MVDRDAPRIEAVLLALETYTHDTAVLLRDQHVHAQDCGRGCRGAVELTDQHYIRRYWGALWGAAPQENRHGL